MSRSVFFSYCRSHKACRTFEFAFRLEPILKLTSWQAAALLVNFVSAAPDLVVILCVVCRGIFCVRRNGACVKLQILISLGIQCHTQVPSFLIALLSISASAGAPDTSALRVPSGASRDRGRNGGIGGSKPKNDTGGGLGGVGGRTGI